MTTHLDALFALQISTHAEQHISLQGRRLAALTDQLEQASSQATQLSLSLEHAHARESAHKWQRDSLQRKLALCEGDIQALESKLSAAHMEAAGGCCISLWVGHRQIRRRPTGSGEVEHHEQGCGYQSAM